MLTEQRLSEILKIVEERKSVSVLELTELLNTSESTVRRDLTFLHNQGQINKVHGGATALELSYSTKDAEVSMRQDMNREDKVKIAKYAASLIQPDDFVYLDAGTSTEIMVDYITEKNAVFVTNGTVHARKLAQKGCLVYVLGGEFKAATEAIIGGEALLGLEKYNFTKGFLGVNGATLLTGYSTPDVKEAMVKQKAMQHCKEKYILCDNSKFNKISAVSFGEFNSAKIITTEINDETFRKCNNIVEVNKL